MKKDEINIAEERITAEEYLKFMMTGELTFVLRDVFFFHNHPFLRRIWVVSTKFANI
ncbi:MAG: hypothetical protein K6G10_10805 [Butyrivibrio sp.]|nr:hypothetical protein [Butyrivibrio sp.]